MRAGKIDPPPLSNADADDPDADGGAAVCVGGWAVFGVDVGFVDEVVGVI
jgi:hypothetical protein